MAGSNAIGFGTLPGGLRGANPSVPANSPLAQISPVYPDLWARAVQQYPILKGSDIAHIHSSKQPGDDRLLEFWSAGDEGDRSTPRPKGLPLSQPGIQIFSKSVKPSDVAADAVSHLLVHTDPALKQQYQQFVQTFNTPAAQQRLQRDYQWAQQNEGEKRPFQEWAATTRIPAYFRGYLFQQWPQSTYDTMFDPQQRAILDSMAATLKKPK